MTEQLILVDAARVNTIVLDARPLSQIIHPRAFEEITAWFDRAVDRGYRVVIPEIVDYEVRRGLLRISARKQLEELNALVEAFYLTPLSRSTMQDAAHVWARARNLGRPFTSDDRLDGDAILIAQVRALGDPGRVPSSPRTCGTWRLSCRRRAGRISSCSMGWVCCRWLVVISFLSPFPFLIRSAGS